MGTNCDPLIADLFLYSYEGASIKEIMMATTSFEISNQLRDLYSMYRCCGNVATQCTYKWKVHNEKIEIISLFVKFRS